MGSTSKYQPYPSYKDSGVEWLGQVPVHWSVGRIKNDYFILGGSTPKSGVGEFWDGDITWVTPADLNKEQGIVINQSKRNITEEGLNSCGTKLVPKDSVILSTRAPIGTLGIAGKDLCTNQGCKALVPNKSLNSKYLAYLLLTIPAELNVRGRGTTFLELSSDDLGSVKMPLLSLKEQNQIVSFLDQETGKMDLLIEKQQAMIALLKEKRQAVISHAVTKGLNPNTPLKDSGIKWLGQIPEHWEVKKGRYIYDLMQTGTTPPTNNQTYFNGDVNWFNPKDLNNETLFNSEKRLTDLAVHDRQVKIFPSNSVLVVGIGATAGKTSYLRVNATFNQQITGFKSNKVHNLFLFYAFKALTSTMLKVAKFTTLPILNNEFFSDFELVMPPRKEQEEIINYLEKQTQKIDTLIEKSQHAIELLKERKTALISAAVTGKIDLRGRSSV